MTYSLADLRVADHANVTLWENGGVVLDLRAGRFYHLNGEAARLVTAIGGVTGSDRLTVQAGELAFARRSAESRRFLGELVDRGLVTPSGCCRDVNGARSPRAAWPADRFVGNESRRWLLQRVARRMARGGQVADRIFAAAAVVTAYCMMRWLSMERIVTFLQWLKAGAATSVTEEEYGLCKSAVERSGAKYVTGLTCFSESLATALYCLGKGLAVTWCVGVRNDPFRAHAWCQPATEHEERATCPRHGYERIIGV